MPCLVIEHRNAEKRITFFRRSRLLSRCSCGGASVACSGGLSNANSTGDVTADSFSAGDVTAGSFSADDVTAGGFSAGDVTIGSFSAGDVTDGSFGDVPDCNFSGWRLLEPSLIFSASF
jgi:hypothetical protein